MRWHNTTEATPETRARANALFNQAYASHVIPRGTTAMMTYIDVHTEHLAAAGGGDGPVYRVFRTGAVDVGLPDAPEVKPEPTVTSYFASMAVRFLHHEPQVLAPEVRVESYEEEFTPGVGADETLRTSVDIYNHMYRHLLKEHGFNPGESAVVSWTITPNQLLAASEG
jgi:hypothetical protein